MTEALDLFRGAGGWSLAARRLGITDLGVENAKWANATATEAGFTTIHDDVWTLPTERLRVSGHIASPPCPTFSVAGKGLGRKHLETVVRAVADNVFVSRARCHDLATDDKRTNLVLMPLAAWYEGAPEWVAWEQVPAVLPVWEACAEVMEQFGYRTWTGNLQAEQYGVPQTRKRAVLMARYKHEVEPPAPTHSRYYPRDPTRLDPDVKPWVSMAEGLGWGMTHRPSMTVTGGGTATGGAEPFGNAARQGIRREQDAGRWWGPGGLDPRTPATTVAGDSRLAARLHHFHGEQGRDPVTSEDVRAALEQGPDWAYVRPSTTIVGTFKPEIVAAPEYRTTVSRQNARSSVKVTVTEAGILQSFPADHPWQGGKNAQFLQVGNAIPPLLAEAVLSQLVAPTQPQPESRIQ